MPYPHFDLARLRAGPPPFVKLAADGILPLDFQGDSDSDDLRHLGEELVKARNQGAATIFLCDSQTITSGVSRHLIDLISRGLVTHIAFDADAARLDWQMAWTGECGTSVDELRECAARTVSSNFGKGEWTGLQLCENAAPHIDDSILAQGYRWGVPVTIHSSSTPLFPIDATNIGIDFLVLANSIENLDQGVVYQFGLPAKPLEVFFVGLDMARSVAAQFDRTIDEFTAATFTDPTVTRSLTKVHTAALGDRGYAVQGSFQDFIPALRHAALAFAGWDV